MAAASSHRLTANPVSLSAESCMSQRPRSPLTWRPLAATVALYVFSNSFHEPGRSFPHVIRMIMSVPPCSVVPVVLGAVRPMAPHADGPPTAPVVPAAPSRGGTPAVERRWSCQASRGRGTPDCWWPHALDDD